MATTYGTYPVTSSSTSFLFSGHYPTQYNQNAAQLTSSPQFLPTFPQPQPPSSPVPDLPRPSPDLTYVTPSVASKAIQRLLCYKLRDAGFDAAEAMALQRLEREVTAFVEQLYERAHEYANLANRSGPVVTDLQLACQDLELSQKILRRTGKKNPRKKKKKPAVAPPTLILPAPRSPSPELLPSDDEDVIPVKPITLRGLPPYFPNLPPKHTYLRTPASPPKKAALPSLEKKLKTASLVQESLRNLLLATEDSSNQEDGELLGHIVNWETSVYPRKRWKISS